jgi:Tol biopolymer transport system component
MGEVYRATDTKLGRDVAIKVLPPEVAQDPERLGRFKREAHLLAALNHPNIAAIHGLEEADGKPFLVLELVEGEDLKECLARSAIPVNEALEIAIQIAEALEEAHSKGIVHRDLKPSNVQRTLDGRVKVLDFGIAKAWSGADAPSATMLSESPTMTATGTVAGAILGTAAYMSPEQARGKPVDKRTDVWSFGVLLGEMLTGRALFSGDTVADIIGAVLTKEPNLEALPAATPEGVRRLLGRCLRKDPRTRWPDIGAARLELQDALASAGTEAEVPAAVGQQARAARRRLTHERWVWAAVVVVLAVAASLGIFLRPTETPEARLTAHFTVDTPAGVTLDYHNPLAVSPDGAIVFAGRSPDGTAQLWIRPVGAPNLRGLPGTEGGGQPFWSPDGASIGFFSGGELKKVSLASGTVQRICVLPPGNLPAGTWGSEGTIVFSLGLGLGRGWLYAVSAAGGEATLLTTPDELTGHWWPQFLPDGRRFLFESFGLQGETAGAWPDNAGVYVGSLDAPDERRRLLPVPMRSMYGSGHLLFVQDGSTLMAQPFDVARAELAGDPVAVASSVAWGMVERWGWFSVSATGVLAYVEGIASDVRQLVWLDREGKRLGTLGEPRPYGGVALSPDGRRVAAEVIAGTGLWDIWAIHVARGTTSLVTTGPTGALSPVWSPDGRELIFRGNTASKLYRKELRADATALALPETVEGGIPEDWSHDGQILLYRTSGEENAFWAQPVEGDGSPELVLKSTFSVGGAQMSPDGRWLAYVSNESGRNEIYVAPFRRPGELEHVSVDGGSTPKWRIDGSELFYRSYDGKLMAVDIRETGSGLEVGPPEVLVSADALMGAALDSYAVTADGQSFLVKMRVDEDVKQRIHVVINWSSPIGR